MCMMLLPPLNIYGIGQLMASPHEQHGLNKRALDVIKSAFDYQFSHLLCNGHYLSLFHIPHL